MKVTSSGCKACRECTCMRDSRADDFQEGQPERCASSLGVLCDAAEHHTRLAVWPSRAHPNCVLYDAAPHTTVSICLSAMGLSGQLPMFFFSGGGCRVVVACEHTERSVRHAACTARTVRHVCTACKACRAEAEYNAKASVRLCRLPRHGRFLQVKSSQARGAPCSSLVAQETISPR